jgi:type I restriction enzyme S subunit
MTGRYHKYLRYKDTEVEWLREIPEQWEVKKLKYQASIQPSNVDKKSKEGEQAVGLCNYTDVYYNDIVDGSLEYMVASASYEQIEKFTLRAGDTIITKDSEDPADIAVPAYVPQDLPGVICGYHLAMIRPFDLSYGLFIKRVFEGGYARAYFCTRSNGLTRYGLGTYPLSNVYYPRPPKEEAEQIANFLDHETAKIDTLIDKQQQLIKLLKEKRQAVISHAVTKGLNPDAPMKDSGVEWLGEVPEHWAVVKIKYQITHFEQGWSPQCEARVAGENEYGVLKVGCVNGGVFRPEENKALPENLLPQMQYSLKNGDLLISRANTKELVGSAAVVDRDYKQLLLCDKLYRLRLVGKIDPRYVSFILSTQLVRQQIELEATGASNSMQNIGQATIRGLAVPLPPENEMADIMETVGFRLNKYQEIISRVERQVELLKERRKALISAAVTGKIDVRNWKPEK